MKQRLLQQVGRSARLKVINELKRSQGMSVTRLAELVGMSYMGIKGICLDLQKRGLVDTWRDPQKLGRPQLLYRLTDRAQELFPAESQVLAKDLLESAQRLFGPTAPDKLLLVVYQKMGERYAAKLRAGEPQTRPERLANLRDQDGYMAQFEPATDLAPAQIIEHHSPIADVLSSFPIVARLETELFQRLLGFSVQREQSTASGLFRAVFSLGAPI